MTLKTSSIELRSMKVTPHLAQNANGRRSAMNNQPHSELYRHQRIRKHIKKASAEIFSHHQAGGSEVPPAATASDRPSPSLPTALQSGAIAEADCGASMTRARELPADRPPQWCGATWLDCD